MNKIIENLRSSNKKGKDKEFSKYEISLERKSRAHTKENREIENPFESIKQERKFGVLGQKEQEIHLSKAKSNQLNIRRDTIVKEFHNKPKENVFEDFREFREKNFEDKRNKQLRRVGSKLKSKSKFNLEDESDLKNEQTLGENEPESKKQRNNVFNDIIQKSKKMKGQKRKDRNEYFELKDELDADFSEISSLLKIDGKKEKQEDDYDKTIKELLECDKVQPEKKKKTIKESLKQVRGDENFEIDNNYLKDEQVDYQDDDFEKNLLTVNEDDLSDNDDVQEMIEKSDTKFEQDFEQDNQQDTSQIEEGSQDEQEDDQDTSQLTENQDQDDEGETSQLTEGQDEEDQETSQIEDDIETSVLTETSELTENQDEEEEEQDDNETSQLTENQDEDAQEDDNDTSQLTEDNQEGSQDEEENEQETSQLSENQDEVEGQDEDDNETSQLTEDNESSFIAPEDEEDEVNDSKFEKETSKRVNNSEEIISKITTQKEFEKLIEKKVSNIEKYFNTRLTSDQFKFILNFQFKLSSVKDLEEITKILKNSFHYIEKEATEILRKKLYSIHLNLNRYPNISEIYFLKLLLSIYKTQDYRHSIITPLGIFLNQILAEKKVESHQDIISGLYICSMNFHLLKNELYSPESLIWLENLIESEWFKNTKDIIPIKKLSPETSEKNEIYFYLFEVLKLFLNLNYPSYKEIFENIKLKLKNVKVFSKVIKVMIERIEMNEKEKREPLQWLHIKPTEMKTFEPLIYEEFRGRMVDNNNDRLQKKILEKKIKREKRSTVRELRKDNIVLRKAREEEQKKVDEHKKERYKQAIKHIENERSMPSQLDFSENKKAEELKKMRKARKKI